MAVVVKGRTLAKGFTGKIENIFTYQVNYYKRVRYAIFDTGEKINIANLEKIAG